MRCDPELKLSDDLLAQFAQFEADAQDTCIAYVEGGKRFEIGEVKQCCEVICKYCKKPMSCCGLDIDTDEYNRPIKCSEYHVAGCTNPKCHRTRKIRKQVIETMDWTTIGIPNNCIGKTYERRNRNCEENITNGLKFLASNLWCLLLHGTSGNGKTLFSVELLKGWHRKFQQGCYFLPISQLFEELRNAQGSGDSEYHVLKRYSDYTFLVIDDIGANRGTEWQVEKVFEIVERRYRAKHKTVITTNLNGGELEEIYGKRLTRRTEDNGGAIEFKTPKIEPRAYKDV